MKIHNFVILTLFLGIACIAVTFILIKKQNEIKTLHQSNTMNKSMTPLEMHSTTPLISNQWFSTLYTSSFPTQSIYAFPLAYKISPQGLSLSLPKVVKQPNTIFATYDEDFSVGLKSGMQKPIVHSLGDWSITLNSLSKENNSLTYTIAQGVPFVVLHNSGEDLTLHFSKDFSVFPKGRTENLVGSQTVNDFLLRVGTNYYAVVPKDAVTITINGKNLEISNTSRLFIGALDTEKNYNLFVTNSNAEVTNTQFSYDFTDNQLITTYIYDGSEDAPLITLLPHQMDNISGNIENLGSYSTLRGEATLTKTSTFTTKINALTPPDSFTKLTNLPSTFPSQLATDIATYMTTPPPTSQDYFYGIWLGKGTSLLQLAQVYNDSQKQKLQSFMENNLKKSLDWFSYDPKKTSVIATHPEFGNEQLNDHHFHYGYYIRTAAVLSQMDPEFKNEIRDQINEMVNDIANTDRKSNKYPYLRNYSPYESHSWADGYGNTNDGNNQESTSEGVNAWYSIYLWGKVTNNSALSNIGLYLYNSESLGAKYYWWGANGMYTPGYNHSMASIVWGGKVDFATWFSGETNMKYGIQILPLTPGSGYLGQLSNFNSLQTDYVKSGGNIKSEWGDMIVALKSFYDSSKAIEELPQVQKLEGMDTKSILMQTVYSNVK